jgi:predicted site-specific integrase-resolvase
MRTTTDPKNWRFHFTITDLGRLLGKSPVTLRKWDRGGFVTIPRDPSGDRRLGIDDVTDIASKAYRGGRIGKRRYDLVCATMTLISMIERENTQ